MRQDVMKKVHDEYATAYHLGGVQEKDDIFDPRKMSQVVIGTLNRLSRKLEPMSPWVKHLLMVKPKPILINSHLLRVRLTPRETSSQMAKLTLIHWS